MVERKQETDRFEAARRSVEDVFIRGRQFPERVFRQPFAHFGLLSFTYNTSPAIWTLFQRLAGQHGDREISVISIDPDAFGELRETHGEAGVRSLAVLTSGDTYHHLMTDVHAKNAQGFGVVFYLHPTLAWVPDSLQWAAWGERDYSTIVFGFRRPPQPSFAELARTSGLRPWNLDEVCENVQNDFDANPVTKPRPEAVAACQAYCAEFRRNYGGTAAPAGVKPGS